MQLEWAFEAPKAARRNLSPTAPLVGASERGQVAGEETETSGEDMRISALGGAGAGQPGKGASRGRRWGYTQGLQFPMKFSPATRTELPTLFLAHCLFVGNVVFLDRHF